MCVAGEYEIPVPLRYLDEGAHCVEQSVPYISRGVPDKQVEVEGDLIVAAAARVKLERHVPDDLAQPPLDGRVYVLVFQSPRKPPRFDLFEHRAQAPYELLGLLFGHYLRLAEHPSVGEGALYIVRSEPDSRRGWRRSAARTLLPGKTKNCRPRVVPCFVAHSSQFSPEERPLRG
jgi:hypothetical protein